MKLKSTLNPPKYLFLNFIQADKSFLVFDQQLFIISTYYQSSTHNSLQNKKLLPITHPTTENEDKFQFTQIKNINPQSTASNLPKVVHMKVAKLCGCFSEEQIVQNIQICPIHNTPYMYLCLNSEPLCKENPLMCTTCLQSHKGHQFQSINNYFTGNFRHVLKTGTSANGDAVARMYDHVLSDMQKMRGKLNRQLDKVQATAKSQIEALKEKYPLKGTFNIPGTQINKQNIHMLMSIVQRQKSRVWVPSSQKYIRSLLGQVTTMIANLIQDLDQYINGKPWQTFTQDKTQSKINDFVMKYSTQYNPNRYYFKFSPQDKHYNIKITQQGLLAQYLDPNPSNPSILADNCFTRTHDTVYFKVAKIKKTMKLFDASLIVVGACIPDVAKTFGYRNLIDPAHGAYMIGSNGKSYHSNSVKYDRKSHSFSFDQSDVIAVTIDYRKKTIHFSKWGFFERKFYMELQIKDEDLEKLTPCVLFNGQKGAMVRIVDEIAYRHKHEDLDEI